MDASYVVWECHIGFEEFQWLYVGDISSTLNIRGNGKLGFSLVAMPRAERGWEKETDV